MTAYLRVSVAIVVPLIAMGAHLSAGGQLPGLTGLLLTAGIGAIAACVLRDARFVRVAAVLTAAQAASHLMLALSHGHVSAPADVVAMAATHLVAIPVSALVIVVVAHLVSVVTSVLRRLCGPSLLTAVDRTALVELSPRALCGTSRVTWRSVRGPPTMLLAPH